MQWNSDLCDILIWIYKKNWSVNQRLGLAVTFGRIHKSPVTLRYNILHQFILINISCNWKVELCSQDKGMSGQGKLSRGLYIL